MALYGNFKQLSALASTLNFLNIPSLPTPTDPQSSEFLAAIFDPLVAEYTTIHGWGWPDPNGLRTQSVAYYRNPKPDRATVAPADGTQVLSRIPGSSYISFNSFDFTRQWQRIVETAEEDPDVKAAFDEFRTEVRENLDLDLEEELISLLDWGVCIISLSHQRRSDPLFIRPWSRFGCRDNHRNEQPTGNGTAARPG